MVRSITVNAPLITNELFLFSFPQYLDRRARFAFRVPTLD